MNDPADAARGRRKLASPGAAGFTPPKPSRRIAQPSLHVRTFLRWLVLVSSLGVVGYGLFAYLALVPGTTVHPTMKATYAEHPVRIIAHVVFSALALAVGPLQFFPAIRRRVALHRALGYVYFTGVFAGGIAGLATAFVAYGGLVSQVGFGLLAVVWLLTATAALRAIKRRDFTAHETWSVRCFALTYSAVTLRGYLGLFFASGMNFDHFYPLVAWLAWVPNLLFVEWVLLRATPRPARVPSGGAWQK